MLLSRRRNLFTGFSVRLFVSIVYTLFGLFCLPFAIVPYLFDRIEVNCVNQTRGQRERSKVERKRGPRCSFHSLALPVMKTCAPNANNREQRPTLMWNEKFLFSCSITQCKRYVTGTPCTSAIRSGCAFDGINSDESTAENRKRKNGNRFNGCSRIPFFATV